MDVYKGEKIGSKLCVTTVRLSIRNKDNQLWYFEFVGYLPSTI